jgi:glutathione S-transferase
VTRARSLTSRNFADVHVADDAGLTLADYPSVSAWLARVRTQPRFIDDLAPLS